MTPCSPSRAGAARVRALNFSNAMKYKRGFTYLGLLILLAILGIVSAAGLRVGKVVHRRVAEEALLDVGKEFSQALERYRRMTPVGQAEAPLELAELLKDPRFPVVVRHLRKLYADPVTGRVEWGVVREEDTRRIVGIHSLSTLPPVKVANFARGLGDLGGKLAYSEWIFRANPGALPQVIAAGQRGVTPSSPFISPGAMVDTTPAAPSVGAGAGQAGVSKPNSIYIDPIEMAE